MPSTVRNTALADRWNGVRPNCRKLNYPSTRLSFDASPDTRDAVLCVLERLQLRFETIVDGKVHRALVAGLVYRQRHAIEALLQDVNRDGDRSGARAPSCPVEAGHAASACDDFA